MKKIFLLFFFGICNCTYGQNKPYQFVIEQVSTASTASRIEILGKDTVLISLYNNTNFRQNVQNELEFTYKGTPYFQNGWFKGKVTLTADSKPGIGVIAFDLVKNQIFFTYSKDKEAIEIKPYEFEINGHIFRKYNNQYSAAGNGYYEKILEGEIELFRQFICKYSPAASMGRTGYEQSNGGYEGYFVKSDVYFVNYHEKLTKVGKNFKVFNGNQEKAKLFAEKNNLSLQNPADLIKIVKYVNSPDKMF